MIAEVLSGAAPVLLRIRAGELHAVLLVDDGNNRAVLHNRFKAVQSGTVLAGLDEVFRIDRVRWAAKAQEGRPKRASCAWLRHGSGGRGPAPSEFGEIARTDAHV